VEKNKVCWILWKLLVNIIFVEREKGKMFKLSSILKFYFED